MHRLIADGYHWYNGAKVSGKRLRTLLRDPKCVKCGRRGSIWAVQRNNTQTRAFHFNLWSWSFDDNGHQALILMTRDHIFPTHRGGSDLLCNSQTMCVICNGNKGAKWPFGVPYTLHNNQYVPALTTI